jgi:DNA-binding IclR family transcriptional regulator
LTYEQLKTLTRTQQQEIEALKAKLAEEVSRSAALAAQLENLIIRQVACPTAIPDSSAAINHNQNINRNQNANENRNERHGGS